MIEEVGDCEDLLLAYLCHSLTVLLPYLQLPSDEIFPFIINLIALYESINLYVTPKHTQIMLLF